MKAVRTPDERFDDLPDFPWDPHYVEDLGGYEGLRMAYIDEGPRDAEHTYLCLHGEPSWSFLYRKMIPVFLEAGGRVVAPDFFGFGRSDKPVEDSAYSFGFHRGSLTGFLDHMELTRFTLVVQDWGGLLGLTLPIGYAERIERLIVMNTAIATGTNPGEGFLAWRDYCLNTPDLDVANLMTRAIPNLKPEEAAAYDAPFPSAQYKAGVRTFPALVPITGEMEGAAMSKDAARFWMGAWDRPSFMAIGMQDPVLGPKVMMALHAVIKGCPPPLELAQAGHFVQESGEEVARAALAHFASL
jgi:haloalkane dehalogenase